MKELTLIRAPSTEHGTFGMLLDKEGIPFCLTLERPWLNNEVEKSCIPSGMYLCKRVDSPKFGDTFEITVRGRTDILFHIGNFITDTTGCVILGEQFEPINGVPAVRSSGVAFDEFMGKLKSEDKFILYVVSLNLNGR